MKEDKTIVFALNNMNFVNHRLVGKIKWTQTQKNHILCDCGKYD